MQAFYKFLFLSIFLRFSCVFAGYSFIPVDTYTPLQEGPDSWHSSHTSISPSYHDDYLDYVAYEQLKQKRKERFQKAQEKAQEAIARQRREYKQRIKEQERAQQRQQITTLEKEISALPDSAQEYKHHLTQFKNLALQAHNAYAIELSSKILDVCWGLLECAKAITLGAKDGIINTVDSCLHPVRSVQNLAHGMIQTAQAMAYLAKECGAYSYYSIADQEKLFDRYLEHKERIEEFIHALNSIPKKELLRQATALGVETALLNTVITEISHFSKCSLEALSTWNKAAQQTNEYAVAIKGAPTIITSTASEYLEFVATGLESTIPKMRGKSATPLKGAAQAWLPLEEEIALLQLQFNKDLPNFNYRHIFQPDIKTIVAKNGTKYSRISGWHHDLNQVILKKAHFNGHPIEFLKLKRGPCDLYTFDWKMLGKEKTSTFFPSCWTREQVMKKIVEAKKYIERQKVPFEKQQQNGTFARSGFTQEGIEIRFIVDKHKKNIITVFPKI